VPAFQQLGIWFVSSPIGALRLVERSLRKFKKLTMWIVCHVRLFNRLTTCNFFSHCLAGLWFLDQSLLHLVFGHLDLIN